MVALRSTLCGAFKDQRSVCHDHKTLAVPAPRPARGAGQCTTDRTLLEVLREDLGCTGTKEGCGEGDCGACTVVLGEADGHGKVRYSAVNSCIRLAHSIDGMALWTAEDLAEDPLIQPVATSTQPADQTTHHSALHPAQEAMVQCHGSQCGFCTPVL